MAIAWRYVDGDTGINHFLAERVNIIHFEGKMPEITPTLVNLAVPVIGQFDQRGAFGLDLLEVLICRQVYQRELTLFTFITVALDQAKQISIKSQ